MAAGTPSADRTGGSAAVERVLFASFVTTISIVSAAAVLIAAVVLLARGLSGAIPISISWAAPVALVAAAALVATGSTARVALRPRHRKPPSPAPVPEPAPTPAPAEPPDPTGRRVIESAGVPWPDARLVQRIERYERPMEAGGCGEAAVGLVVARFEAGSRVSVVHVGFCPPFNATPRVTVSTECDGLEVTLAAVEVLPWGVRIEGRLEEPPEEPVEVEVDLVAVPPGSA